MKCRIVNLYASDESMPGILEVEDEILPRFSRMPHFLGAFVLKAEVGRPQLVLLSLWDDGLEGSEALSREFRDEILRRTGMTPGRQAFDVLRAVVRVSEGGIRTELSWFTDEQPGG